MITINNNSKSAKVLTPVRGKDLVLLPGINNIGDINLDDYFCSRAAIAIRDEYLTIEEDEPKKQPRKKKRKR